MNWSTYHRRESQNTKKWLFAYGLYYSENLVKPIDLVQALPIHRMRNSFLQSKWASDLISASLTG